VGSETAVADEDDRALREPAKDLKHALSRPVRELFVTPPPIDGEAFRGGHAVHRPETGIAAAAERGDEVPVA